MKRFTTVGEPQQSILIHTPAKLNLFLKVLGKRADGFHDLETLMVSIRLFDTIRFESSLTPNIDLRCRSRLHTSQHLPTDHNNLIVKAAHLLQQKTGCEAGANILLHKRIPSEAGMGGGSSDAAATLIGLNALWKLDLSHETLHLLAAQLGSDVNFFLDCTAAAMCTGRGEQTQPFRISQQLHLVVVKPLSGLSTGAVFQAWASENERGAVSALAAKETLQHGTRNSLRHILHNCLEQPARSLNPEIDNLLKTFSKLDVVCSAMTGSGSACFAICRSQQHAHRIARRMQALRLGDAYIVTTGV